MGPVIAPRVRDTQAFRGLVVVMLSSMSMARSNRSSPTRSRRESVSRSPRDELLDAKDKKSGRPVTAGRLSIYSTECNVDVSSPNQAMFLAIQIVCSAACSNRSLSYPVAGSKIDRETAFNLTSRKCLVASILIQSAWWMRRFGCLS